MDQTEGAQEESIPKRIRSNADSANEPLPSVFKCFNQLQYTPPTEPTTLLPSLVNTKTEPNPNQIDVICGSPPSHRGTLQHRRGRSPVYSPEPESHTKASSNRKTEAKSPSCVRSHSSSRSPVAADSDSPSFFELLGEEDKTIVTAVVGGIHDDDDDDGDDDGDDGEFEDESKYDPDYEGGGELNDASEYANPDMGVENGGNGSNGDDLAELCSPHQPFVEVNDWLRAPQRIIDALFDYQQVALKWMAVLHESRVGGILGDEMGLGKTVQVAAFFASLDFSDKFKTALIVCPTTVMLQWKRELQKWWPKFRVGLYHKGSVQPQSVQETLHDIMENGGILITSYDMVRINIAKICRYKLQYVVLDEGHAIRNPDVDTTIACKRLRTSHRLILTGSPIQNNLKELWSLFDFIYPGKLGTYPIFEEKFAKPITIGGYSNASELQLELAYQCALILKDMISPYMLRRMKSEVGINLKTKQEKILMCHLTQLQKEHYIRFEKSTDLEAILDGRFSLFHGIDHLRKVCNHPDLLDAHKQEKPPSYGSPEKSGKIILLLKLLNLLREQNHRVLLFSQTIQMLDIIEGSIKSMGYNYLRMDGKTRTQSRLDMVDRFNVSDDIFVYLLTTRVGGLGINLIGADRVIIFDPDWNPSVDAQARERSWRIGQKKDVIIYRLVTQGTIEEKIYHRQLFKQTLSNKVLKDPSQNRLFRRKDLRNLFTYYESESGNSASHDIFGSLDETLIISEGDVKKDDEIESTTPAPVQKDDTYIIRELFKDGGLGSVLLHDKIERKEGVEQSLLQHEAMQMAKAAAQVLKKSQQACKKMKSQGPTWTGKRGEAGNPDLCEDSEDVTKPISGKDLLSILQQRSAAPSGSGPSRAAEASASRPHPHARTGLSTASSYQKGNPESIAIDLQTFFLSNQGIVTTDQILRKYGTSIHAKDKLAFRNILREIANLDEGVWQLKPEYSHSS